VVGVLPYVKLDIDDEDSLSERLTSGPASLIDIAVIRLPRLSNFTDFRALEAVEGVSVRYVGKTAEFGEPDLVILPGTKNTMADLLWLRQSGLEGKVLRFSHAGGPVLGICGGYQMLGEELSDPLGVEQGGTVRGMGLLPIRTVFTGQKTRTRVSGTFGSVGGVLSALSDQPFEGYEIHMGESTGGSPLTGIVNQLSGGKQPDGCQQGSVYGTYVHGILDQDAVAGAVVRALAERKGIDPARLGQVSGAEHKQRQYDLLAQTLREHMDMQRIYDILKEGIA
jgi:adenosylcobyric acid synthase